MIKEAKNIIKGLLTVLKHFKKDKVTLLYPEEKDKNENVRGLIICDTEKCIGCGICKKVCPVLNVITIENKKVRYMDFSRCIFCKNCVYECPSKAMIMTKQYELATDNKKTLLSEYK